MTNEVSEGEKIRLDSWKAIGRYLKRDERTVQRWELQRKLPVHRLPGGKRGNIFAYTSELDAWLASDQSEDGQATSSATGGNAGATTKDDKAGARELEAAGPSVTAGNVDQDATPKGDNARVSMGLDAGSKMAAEEPPWSPIPRVTMLAIAATLGAGLLVLAGIASLLFVAGAFWAGWTPRGHGPQWERLSLAPGSVVTARFDPAGTGVLYTKSWNGSLQLLRAGEENSVSLAGAELLAVSARGRLAVLLDSQPVQRLAWGGERRAGTLAIAEPPGAPEKVAEEVSAADWSPDGARLAFLAQNQIAIWDSAQRHLAVVYSSRGENRPAPSPGAGRISSVARLAHVRFSPDGNFLAFEEHTGGGAGGHVTVFSLAEGRPVRASREYAALDGLAWAPGGLLWFSAGDEIPPRGAAGIRIYSLDKAGNEEVRWAPVLPEPLELEDVSARGEALIRFGAAGTGAVVERGGEELALPGAAQLGDLSADGARVLFSEGAGTKSLYLEELGGAPLRLGEAATPAAFSPDGQSALAVTAAACPQAVWFPALGGEHPGAGRQLVTPEGLCVQQIMWLPEPQRFLFTATDAHTGAMRCYAQRLGEPAPTAVSPEGFQCLLPAPDGHAVLARAGRRYFRLSLDGGPPAPLPLEARDAPLRWDARDRIDMLVRRRPYRLAGFDPASGRESPLRPAPAGLDLLGPARLSADGKTLAYTATQAASQLYVLRGLR
jgi:hypothetical protein